MDGAISDRKALSLKRSRVKYSKRQTEKLERIFEHNQYPDSDIQEKIAKEIGVSVERIAIWFQNRRSKFKRQCHSSHVTWMRRQIFPSHENTNCIFGTPPHLGRPVCHVLSPLEPQVLRDDVIAMSTPGFKSPCGVKPSTGSLHGKPTRTPEVLHYQNSCTLGGPKHTPYSSLKCVNLTQSPQDTGFFLLDAISRIPHEPSFEGIQSPERIVPKTGPKSALNSPVLNDLKSVTDTAPVSSDARKQFRYTKQQQEIDSYISDRENASPLCPRLHEHAERSPFSEKPFDLSDCYTPMDLTLSKSLHNNLHELANFDSFIEVDSGCQRSSGPRIHNTKAMEAIVRPTDGYSSNILADWI